MKVTKRIQITADIEIDDQEDFDITRDTAIGFYYEDKYADDDIILPKSDNPHFRVIEYIKTQEVRVKLESVVILVLIIRIILWIVNI